MKLNRAILSLSFVALIVSVSAYADDDEHKRGTYSHFNQEAMGTLGTSVKAMAITVTMMTVSRPNWAPARFIWSTT